MTKDAPFSSSQKSMQTEVKKEKELGKLPQNGPTKVWLLLFCMSAVFLLCGYQMGERRGLLLGFLLSLGLFVLVIFYDRMFLKSRFAGDPLEGRDPWGMLPTVSSLAKRLRLKAPSLRLIDSRTPLVFSAGFFVSHSTLFVSESFANRFSSDERKAVLAYELMRLKAGETRAATAAAALMSPLRWIARFLDGILFLQFFRSVRPGQISPFGVLLWPAVAVITRLLVSRRAILRADQHSAALTGSNEVLARALEKLDSYNKTLPPLVDPAEAPLFTVNPLASFRWCDYLQVHPTIRKRIETLVGSYPR